MSDLISFDTIDAMLTDFGFRKSVRKSHLAYSEVGSGAELFLKPFRSGDSLPWTSWAPIRRMLVEFGFLDNAEQWEELVRAKSA